MARQFPSSRRISRSLIWAAAWACVLGTQSPQLCPANPTGGVVVNGNALINQAPGLTTIQQSTNRAVINWGSFSIGSGEQTNFILPNANSATLNRVLGGGPSLLDGRLTSNGHLFLINGSGIVFGKGAMIDTNGLVASTLDTSNASFLAGGSMVFKGGSQAGVTNAGEIRAGSGDVFLIGLQVTNSGTIRAPNGTVGLAAGSEVLIKAVGDERVVVRNAVGGKVGTGVDNSGLIEASVAELKAHNGNVYALAIRNSGRIAATGATKQGGRILLRANGGNIENRGELVARGSAGRGGQIRINAGRKGQATIGGRVDANAAKMKGGNIAVTAGRIVIDADSVISADGPQGGGAISIGSDGISTETILAGRISADSAEGIGGVVRLGGEALTLAGTSITSANGGAGGGGVYAGGGFHGRDTQLSNSANVRVDAGAVLTANAIHKGRGGNVVVFASGSLTFNGSLQALGGALSGDGGRAELSGKKSLKLDGLTGHVHLGAPNGRAGMLVIDPNDILITDLGGGTTVTNPANASLLDAADVSNFLNTASLTIETDPNAMGGSGNITVDGLISWNSANYLTINAQRTFRLAATEFSTGIIQAQGGGNVTINAGRDIVLDDTTLISTTTGQVTLNANQGALAATGNFDGITIYGSIETSGGDIRLAGRAGSGGVVIITGAAPQPYAIVIDGGSLRADGGVISLSTTGGDVMSNGTLSAAGLKLSGNGGFDLSNAGNSIDVLATANRVTWINFENSTGLAIDSLDEASGVLAAGDIRIAVTGGERLSVNQGIDSQGGAIELRAYGIDVNGAALSTMGNGQIRLVAVRDIALNAGASISVVDGNLTLEANQGEFGQSGAFDGIRMSGASLTTSGKGSILLYGRSGDTGDSNSGIVLTQGSTIASTSMADTAGGIELHGEIGGGDNGNRGILLQNADTAISSGKGNITLTGTGNGWGVDNFGVELGVDAAVGSIAGGTVTIISDATLLNAGISTRGGAIAIQSANVVLGSSVTLDTTNNGAASAGGNITFTGIINGLFGVNPDLIIHAGIAGAVALGGAVGADHSIQSVEIVAGTLTGAPNITATAFTLTAGGVMDLTQVATESLSVTGRAGNDTIMLSYVPADLTIRGGAGNDTVTFASAGMPVSTSLGSYSGIENLIGSGSDADTLSSAAGSTPYVPGAAGTGSGTVGALNFSSFENLVGLVPGSNLPPEVVQVTSGSLLQNTVPTGGATGGNTPPGQAAQTTNNFNNTSPGAGGSTGAAGGSTSGGSGTVTTGGAAAGGAGGGTNGGSAGGLPSGDFVGTPPTGVTAGNSQGAGPVTMSGGSPASPATQAQMGAANSPDAQSELGKALGGDGTMGVTSSEHLVSMDAGGSAPGSSTTAQLATGTGSLAQSELALGAGGSGEFPVTYETGPTTMNLGGTAPPGSAQQGMNDANTPETFSDLSRAMGGDGTAPTDPTTGSVAMDVSGTPAGAQTESALAANTAPGTTSELAAALGGTGEVAVPSGGPPATMNGAGTPASPQVASGMGSTVSALSEQELDAALGGDGTGRAGAADGSLPIGAAGSAPPGAAVAGHLNDAASAQSEEELTAALH